MIELKAVYHDRCETETYPDDAALHDVAVKADEHRAQGAIEIKIKIEREV